MKKYSLCYYLWCNFCSRSQSGKLLNQVLAFLHAEGFKLKILFVKDRNSPALPKQPGHTWKEPKQIAS